MAKAAKRSRLRGARSSRDEIARCFGPMAGAVEHVSRPPGLVGRSDVFALCVWGTSMLPRYKAGDLVFVDPTRPLIPGRDVILVMHSGEPARDLYIKRLVRLTPDRVYLRQLNPPAGDAAEFDLDRRLVRLILPVMEPVELLGA